jgi:hypothetical protein
MGAYGEKERRGSDENQGSVQTLEGQEQEEEKEEEMIVCFLYVLSFYEFFYW